MINCTKNKPEQSRVDAPEGISTCLAAKENLSPKSKIFNGKICEYLNYPSRNGFWIAFEGSDRHTANALDWIYSLPFDRRGCIQQNVGT